MTLLAIVTQTDPALLEQLGRIATAQTVMMLIMAVLTVLAVAGAILSYNSFKAMGRTVRALEKVVNELAPRAEPLIDGATRVALDASAISESVRRRVNDVLDTVEDVNVRLRSATDAAEQRIRGFGAVLDVVQSETEGLLLSAASTARGIHATRQALRSPRPQRNYDDLDAEDEE